MGMAIVLGAVINAAKFGFVGLILGLALTLILGKVVTTGAKRVLLVVVTTLLFVCWGFTGGVELMLGVFQGRQ
jgi:hypothetical protein